MLILPFTEHIRFLNYFIVTYLAFHNSDLCHLSMSQRDKKKSQVCNYINPYQYPVAWSGSCSEFLDIWRPASRVWDLLQTSIYPLTELHMDCKANREQEMMKSVDRMWAVCPFWEQVALACLGERSLIRSLQNPGAKVTMSITISFWIC